MINKTGLTPRHKVYDGVRIYRTSKHSIILWLQENEIRINFYTFDRIKDSPVDYTLIASITRDDKNIRAGLKDLRSCLCQIGAGK